MNPLLITHAEDPDGIISHALLMRALSVNDKNSEDHVFVRYDRFAEAFKEAIKKARTHHAVYVADISVNSRLLAAGGKDFALLEELADGKEVHWQDHHDGTFAHWGEVAQRGITVHYHPDYCASLLVAEHFSLDDSYERRLAAIAQKNDYPNSFGGYGLVALGRDLEKIIALQNTARDEEALLGLACALRDETVLDKRGWNLLPQWREVCNAFTQQEAQAYQGLESTVEVQQVGNSFVLFGYASPLLAPKQGPYFLRDHYKDRAEIFVCFFQPPVRNHLVVIRKDAAFPVVPFVQSLGGGGRGTAGGFTLDYDVTSENYLQVKEMLLKELEKYVLKDSV